MELEMTSTAGGASNFISVAVGSTTVAMLAGACSGSVGAGTGSEAGVDA